MNNLTVQGKVEYWCKSCQNCHTIKKTDSGMEYICSDPYDGMEKTLNGDSNVTCSMYEARPNPTHICYEQEVKVVKPGEKVDIPCTKISLLEHELEMDKLRKEIHQLEKEKSNHMKGIERLKKSKEELEKKLNAKNKDIDILLDENKCLKSRNDNQVTMIQGLKLQCNDLSEKLKKTDISKVPKLEVQINNLKYLNGQSYKREEELEKEIKELKDKYEKLYTHYRYDEAIINDIQNVISPEDDSIWSYSEIVNEIKDLKVQSDENGTMYEDLKYWKERCHNAEADVTTLNSKVEVLKNKSDKYLNKIVTQQSTHYKQCARILELENMVNKLQSGEYDDVLAKDIEIKSLQAKYEDAMAGWKDTIDTNDKLNQTIEDQEITIKALLITIKEMCKEDETNA